MRPMVRVLTWLALFLIVDAGVYLVTAREYTGGPLIAATALAFAYLAVVVRGVVRRAAREQDEDPSVEIGGVVLDHVGPTVWPAGFAVAAIMLALGAAVARWVLVPGGVMFVAAALGWVSDVRHQHSGPDHGHAETLSPGSTPPGP
jgi:uncharacterized membrane protein